VRIYDEVAVKICYHSFGQQATIGLTKHVFDLYNSLVLSPTASIYHDAPLDSFMALYRSVR